MKKNLSDWAHIAEIVGTFAIVISLGFVGIQISGNTKEMRAMAAHNVTVSLQTWYNSLGVNGQASRVFRIGLKNPSSLTKDEKVQFIMSIHSVMLAYQESYIMGLDGSLDKSLQIVLLETINTAAPTPGFKWYWQQRRNFFTEEFKGLVDNMTTNKTNDAAKIYQ